MGGVAEDCQVVAAIDDPAKVIENVPQEPWDIKCAKILAPDGIEELFDSFAVSGIFWDDIAPERIKRISPLRRLRSNIK